MCVEFPSRVVAIDELGATVDREGRLRRASTLLVPDAAPGDWVLVAAGTIVRRLDPAEAHLIRITLLEALSREPADAAAGPAAAGLGGSR